MTRKCCSTLMWRENATESRYGELPTGLPAGSWGPEDAPESWQSKLCNKAGREQEDGHSRQAAVPRKIEEWTPRVSQKGLSQQGDRAGIAGDHGNPPRHQPKNQPGGPFGGQASGGESELVQGTHEEPNAYEAG